MTRSQLFLSTLISFLIGIALNRWITLPLLYPLLFCGGAFLIIVIGRRAPVLLLCLFGVSLGLLRAAVVSDLAQLPEGNTSLQGQIVAAPDIRRDHIKYTIEIPNSKSQIPNTNKQKTNSNNQITSAEQNNDAKILVRAPLYPRFRLNDEVSFNCFVRHPEPIEDFAYDRYLALSGIATTCSARHFELVQSATWSFNGALIDGREWVTAQLSRILPEPEASFEAGLLVGARRGLPEWLTEAFGRTGTTHLIALSGFNITIVVNLIMSMAIKTIGRRHAFWFVLLAISLFVIFVGGQASIVRAGIMGCIAAFAGHVGRPSRGINALVLSGVSMVLVNPRILLDDAGFQLSFGSTLGLMLLSGHVDRWVHFLPERFEIRGTISATIAASIFTLPLILCVFGRVSLVSLFVNVLILPLIPFAMAAGTVALLLSVLSLSLGILFGAATWLILRGVIMVVEFFALPNWSLLHFATGQYWWLLLYPLLFAWVWYLDRRQRIA